MYSQKWFWGREQTRLCWNSGQYYWLQIKRDPVTPFLNFSEMFLFDLCLERNSYPLYSHFHNKKDIKLLSEGWIAKFLFLCLSCLWNIGFACGVAVLYGSTAVQRCVPALAPTSRLWRTNVVRRLQGTWSADCGERTWSARCQSGAEVRRLGAGVSLEVETLRSDSAV